jgi:hypothetical protein
VEQGILVSVFVLVVVLVLEIRNEGEDCFD